MSRPPNIIRPRALTLKLPEDVRGRLDLYLFSEVEQRIPVGAYQSFFLSRIREFFGWKREDLARFGFPDGYFISGPREMVESVIQRLEGEKK